MGYPSPLSAFVLGFILAPPGTEIAQEVVPSVPQTFRMEIVAKAVLSTTNLCNYHCIMDSRGISRASGGAVLAYGIKRCWPVPIAGIGIPATGGATPWFGDIEQLPSANQRESAPGATFYDGASGANPSNWLDAQFTGNVADGTGRVVAVAVNGLNGYALGDWVDGRSIKARCQWIARATGLTGATITFEGFRGGVLSEYPTKYAQTVIDMAAGTAGLIYSAEVDCGISSRSAGCRIYPNGIDETNKTFNLGDFLLWDKDATHGLVLTTQGTSNYTQADLIAQLGGGGSPTCTTANAAAALKNMVVDGTRNSVVIHVEIINLSGAEATDFSNGSTAVYQANRETIIGLLNTIAGINGWNNMVILNRTGPTGHLGSDDEPTVNPTYNTLRAKALLAATKLHSNCAFSNDGGLMTCRGVVGGADHTSTLRERAVETYDGLHMTGGPASIRLASYDADAGTYANTFAGNGDISWAYPLWCEIVAAGYFLAWQPVFRLQRIAGR